MYIFFKSQIDKIKADLTLKLSLKVLNMQQKNRLRYLKKLLILILQTFIVVSCLM